ncbi:MAG: hypothetical protein AAB682_02220, partial [Patescibacteria group bacterium]
MKVSYFLGIGIVVFVGFVGGSIVLADTLQQPPPPTNDGQVQIPQQPMMQGGQNSGDMQKNGDLQGQPYRGIAPSGGICSSGWNLETNNGQAYCAPTQEKCTGDSSGSILTTDNGGYKVCWQKIENSQQGRGGQGGPNQGQGFNPGSGQNGNGPDRSGNNNGGGSKSQSQQGGQGQQGGPDFQKMQEQQQKQMLKNAQQGTKQMDKAIASIEKRIAAIEKKGGISSSDLKTAIQQAKEIIAKAKTAVSFDDMQNVGLEDMNEIRQTINDEMQKAEMSLQFPNMLKQANRTLTQQQKALATAQKKASTLKINVSSLMVKWQKSVDS